MCKLEGIQYIDTMSVSTDDVSEIPYACVQLHGYITQPWIKTTIVPNIKKKTANLSICDNYEPIALANVISKVFEHLLLLHCEQFLTKVVN